MLWPPLRYGYSMRPPTPAAIFAALFYLIIVTFPVSVYTGARLFGLPPPAAGLASMLAFAPSAAGLLGSYGLGYGSVTWRGTGLFTQLFALHLLVIGLGVTARALDGGRSERMMAALLLALTSLSHIIFGYAAFVSAALLAVISTRSTWAGRIVRLLDSGRWPALSILIATGALATILLCRRDPRARRLLGLSGVWLILFFGRETWGGLMIVAGVPADLHLHRLQAVFELSAILLGAFGVVELVRWLAKRQQMLAVGCGVAIAIAVISIGAD